LSGSDKKSREARRRHPYPEIFVDLNAQWGERIYSAECQGTIADLAKLGMTLETASGKRFTFVMEDADQKGNLDDIMFNGVIERRPDGSYQVLADQDGIYWRSQIVD